MKNFNLKKVWLGLVIIAVLLFISGLFLTSAQSPQEKSQDLEDREENCTRIMVGRLASTDGSVMKAHSSEGNYRT